MYFAFYFLKQTVTDKNDIIANYVKFTKLKITS